MNYKRFAYVELRADEMYSVLSGMKGGEDTNVALMRKLADFFEKNLKGDVEQSKELVESLRTRANMLEMAIDRMEKIITQARLGV